MCAGLYKELGTEKDKPVQAFLSCDIGAGWLVNRHVMNRGG